MQPFSMSIQALLTPRTSFRQAASRIWLAVWIALPAVLLGTSCVGLPEEPTKPHAELRFAELGDMVNVCVCGDIWFGGLPNANDLDIAQRRGIETLVGLLPAKSEERAVLDQQSRDLGFERLFITLEPGQECDDAVDEVLGFLRREDRGPVLMVSPGGGAAAMMISIYRIVDDGVEPEAAMDAARRAGMKPGHSEETVLSQVARYLNLDTRADSTQP